MKLLIWKIKHRKHTRHFSSRRGNTIYCLGCHKPYIKKDTHIMKEIY